MSWFRRRPLVVRIEGLDRFTAILDRAFPVVPPEPPEPPEQVEAREIPEFEKDFRAWLANKALVGPERGHVLGSWEVYVGRRIATAEQKRAAREELIGRGAPLPGI